MYYAGERGGFVLWCLLIAVLHCLVLWEELPILITSPPTRLTDPLTLSLDNLLPPDIANKPGWTAVKIQNPEKSIVDSME